MRFAVTWQEATLRAVTDITADIREFQIVPTGGCRNFLPGAHLDLALTIGGLPETRSYSLVGEPGGDHYRIAVKRRPDSRGGSAYLWSLAPGARLTITDPKTAFELEFGRKEYLLVAGGIGITPLFGMASLLRRRGSRVRLLYAARKTADLAYLETLRPLLGEDLLLFVSEKGQRIDFPAAFAELGPDALCALCGPMPMLEEARRAWAVAGRPLADLRWETFGTSGRLAAEDFTVRLPRHDLELVVPRNRTLLDALEEAGIDVIHDCRKGECGLCAMDVLAIDGAIDHRDVFFSDHEKEENRRLCACVSRATGTLTLDTDYRPDAV
ncbi:MAG: PDR/VanB family oxidoreductase [Beijerinckiaceae bacterium]|nr:PDR/VanB family oxidoreductase [Beijerinckiaceae bacterium]